MAVKGHREQGNAETTPLPNLHTSRSGQDSHTRGGTHAPGQERLMWLRD